MKTWRVGTPAKFEKAEGSLRTHWEDARLAKNRVRDIEKDKLKAERRKHAKKESAMRCRKRKQEELVKLQEAVDELRAEQSALARKLYELAVESERLNSENSSLMVELGQTYGLDAVSQLTALSADNYTGLASDGTRD